ncbi:uncharacterized protein A4U43_C06F9880 [Asparagus officinalis]|uniref:Uncharacterized protein n=1 Tax=Asparagus officinalis TaxID=4686 RepID=A0A5P1ELE3_ASPOF|nr:uncharacterized protein A4U43_C06F9880 [Asparagus officinalis]
MTSVTFTDKNLLLGTNEHNKPLYAIRLCDGEKITLMLIDSEKKKNLERYAGRLGKKRSSKELKECLHKNNENEFNKEQDKNACRRGGDGDGRRRRWWLGPKARWLEFGYGADGELGSESLVRGGQRGGADGGVGGSTGGGLGRWGVGRRGLTAAWADPPAAVWGVGELDEEGLGGRSSLGGRRENEMKRERRRFLWRLGNKEKRGGRVLGYL